MKIDSTLIMAGGRGTRLGLGTKSHIIYKNKLLLEYVLESCVSAGIKNIVVFLPSKDVEKDISKEKMYKSMLLRKKYDWITWVQYPKDLGLGFRGALDLVKKYFGNKPFYLLCGQSPQSSLYLKKMAKEYKPKSIVLSGYKHRYETCFSVATVKGNRVVEFVNVECTKPRDFIVRGNEYITHMPYILDFNFYDNTLKKDSFKNRIEFYPSNFVKEGGRCYLLENPIKVSEVDYKKDFPSLLRSIDNLN